MRGILAIAALLTAAAAAPAQAENPEQLRQLLETNACRGCDLRGAQLSGVKLTGADLSQANLSQANLANSKLAQADLRGADLSQASLSGANLSGANLKNANLNGTDLRQANLTGSIGLLAQSTSRVSNEVTGSSQGDLSPQTSSHQSIAELSSQNPDFLKLEARRAEDLPLEQFNITQDNPTSPATTTRPSPLERPPTRLFGFETADTLRQQELVLQFGGTSFNNPNDFRDVLDRSNNRSNDAFVRVDYGITDDLQFTLGLAGKDDTRFSNLVRDPSSLQFIYGIIPAQVKWQFYDDDRLRAAAVAGVEFSAPFGPLFFTGGREVTFTTTADPFASNRSEIVGEDDATYFSLAVPVSYQLTEQLGFHLNPQVSFFPGSISARQTAGNTAPTNIGFNGNELDYYGTVFGIGIGVNYSFTPRIQFAADVTPVLTGLNSAGSGGDDSLFVARPVWSAGFKFAANSRVGANLYLTNRFGPIASAPSNLLAQPGGDWGVGLDFTYLPDLTGSYEIEKRDTYPQAQAFLSPLNGFPSATLPMDSVIYQLALGSNLRINPMVRLALLDDLELALNFSYANNTEEVPIEGSIFGRLALLPDDGGALSAAIDLGLTKVDATNRDLDINTFFLYADLPVTYRLPNLGLSFTATPKVVVPAQFQNLDNIFGLSLGATWSFARNTQLLAQVTPVLLGDNQLQESQLPGQQIPVQGKTPLYNVGVRQLFPAGNSLYALDLYVGNSVGDYGFQGISALPDGEVQVGLRFNILNGVP